MGYLYVAFSQKHVFRSKRIKYSLFKQPCHQEKLDLPHQSKNTGLFNILCNLTVLTMNPSVQVSCNILELGSIGLACDKNEIQQIFSSDKH